MGKKTIVVENKSGIGFCGTLTLIFIVLKLMEKIDWSWMWVLSPLWLPAAIIVSFLAVGLLIALIAVLKS